MANIEQVRNQLGQPDHQGAGSPRFDPRPPPVLPGAFLVAVPIAVLAADRHHRLQRPTHVPAFIA